MDYHFTPIAIIRSPYVEKFGTPRQPSLVDAMPSYVELLSPYNHPDTVRGLSGFSHIWLSFVFHRTAEQGWQPLVRPPRLGGNTKVGVFASRSTHRPNPLGLSLVKLLAIETEPCLRLVIQGADLIDGTPVLDIKPYLPFVEALPNVASGFVDGPPPLLTVKWSDIAEQSAFDLALTPDLIRLIEQVLAQDPRPAYQDEATRQYGVTLERFNIRFVVDKTIVRVLEIQPIAQN